ncbi:MAG: biopolymer transporter ExbD [Bacteroidales bacterium]|nr:biopolymer transporter ExbD [Bacteroidales bacterium]MCL2738893.1 biopolymer transporter ExbD [Bacteroidales bacterium]
MAKPAPQINTASMADIAFMMLFFFLVTTNLDVDLGLARMLPQMPDENQQQEDIMVNRRNVLVVQINLNDRISADGQPIDISQLKDRVREFILNPADNPNLSEKEIRDVENFGPYPITKGVISLVSDRGTTYDAYMRVQNELVKAYNELREEFSMQHYGQPYLKLTEDQQKVVRTIYNQAISEAEPKDIGRSARR